VKTTIVNGSQTPSDAGFAAYDAVLYWATQYGDPSAASIAQINIGNSFLATDARGEAILKATVVLSDIITQMTDVLAPIYSNDPAIVRWNLTNALQTVVVAYNCLVGYTWNSPVEMWPDVAEYLRLKIIDFKDGGGDQLVYNLVKGVA
jgi:hypothetical protein